MSAVGDTILTLPVACAVRRAFPEAFIGWVVERNASAMVTHHPSVDEVIVLERGWFVSPKAILAARRQLRRFHFDVSVDCQSISKTALACLAFRRPDADRLPGPVWLRIEPLLEQSPRVSATAAPDRPVA